MNLRLSLLAAAVAALAGLAEVAAQTVQLLEVRVYPVSDLLVNIEDRRYDDAVPGLPDFRDSKSGGLGVAGSGGGGGFGGGGAAAPSPGEGEDIQTLIELLQDTVDPASWEESGGDAAITGFGKTLVVSQYKANHEQIAALLEGTRNASDPVRNVTVEAWWLPLDSAARAPDEKAMRAAFRYRGAVTCFSGQQVYVTDGRRQSLIAAAAPVISPGAVAFDAAVSYVNVGAILRVRPTVLPGATAAVLDLRSVVVESLDTEGGTVVTGNAGRTTPGDAGADTGGGAASIQLPDVSLPTSELATSLLAPLGELVVVGGLAGPQGDEEAEPLFLVVRVTSPQPEKMAVGPQRSWPQALGMGTPSDIKAAKQRP